jgi:hypothetical protein
MTVTTWVSTPFARIAASRIGHSFSKSNCSCCHRRDTASATAAGSSAPASTIVSVTAPDPEQRWRGGMPSRSTSLVRSDWCRDTMNRSLSATSSTVVPCSTSPTWNTALDFPDASMDCQRPI